MKQIIFSLLVLIFVSGAAFTFETAAQTQINIQGPAGSDQFGSEIFALPNGNIVITDPNYDIPNGAANVGAVYLYNGATGALISMLTGSTVNDSIGSASSDLGNFLEPGIIVLANGNFVVKGFVWKNAAGVQVGAATFVNGTTGLSGVVSASNSLIGSTSGDNVGFLITPLTNGNYVVRSSLWDNGSVNNAGAVTFGNGTTGISGIISPSNSLVGSSNEDYIGNKAVTALNNGNFVVSSINWNGGLSNGRGAVTFGNGTTGISGIVSPTNSLIGLTANDQVGLLITALTNGNYVVSSPNWDNGGVVNAGAVTFCSGATATTGAVANTNSLVGSTQSDRIGSKSVTPLTNGNYVVASPEWNNFSGAATFASGTTGITGVVSISNSLVGAAVNTSVGEGGVTALSNGNYVVVSKFWENSPTLNVGAVTFGNGTTRINGEVMPSNSLIGSTANDQVGSDGVAALPNGNFVVNSSNWDGAAQNVGAATFGDGTNGITGIVSASNSLIGSKQNDRVGYVTTALTNGNYVVGSPNWDNSSIVDVGASTFANGTTGITGVVSSSNSLIGSTSGDQVGGSFSGFSGSRPVGLITSLTNGNYVIRTPTFDNSSIADAGAVTLANGTTGITGVISATNSIVGSSANDQIGFYRNDGNGIVSDSLIALPNGDFAFGSPNFDNIGAVNAGALTCKMSATGTSGTLSASNSFLGTTANGQVGLTFVYEAVNDKCVFRRPGNIVTIYSQTGTAVVRRTAFDFDGDGRADLSIFRANSDPAFADFQIRKSSDNLLLGYSWGLPGDKLAPADYDGDGKTDIAVWRESEQNFYILNTSNNSVRVENFGLTGDVLTVGDWDGDGKADLSTFRDGAQSYFFYRGSLNNPSGNITYLSWGTSGDKPQRGDFDGDGKFDAAVFRPSNATWYIRQSSDNSVRYENWGISTDKFVPADYDGDSKTDLAVFRDGVWYIKQSSNNTARYEYFGITSDLPVPADYDGDGKTDVAVFRNGQWYLNRSTSGLTIANFGLSGDSAIPNAFINP